MYLVKTQAEGNEINTKEELKEKKVKWRKLA